MNDYREDGASLVLAERDAALARAADERRALERELYAARARLRQNQRFSALRTSGFGALAGNVVGAIGYLATGSIGWFLIGTTFFTLFTFIVAHIWNPLDDGVADAPATRDIARDRW